MTHLLELIDVSGGYTNAPILRSINLHVDENEIVGILGANGAGKTTMLRAIGGSLPVCKGDIQIAGASVQKKAPWDRVRAGIAHVPEGRHTFADMTVRDNLEVAARARKSRESVDVVFDLFPALRERQKQRAGSLSGGEQQMCVIGRALMTKPKILVIDEMSAGLAPIIVENLVQSLVHLREQGTSTLLVEQSPSYIANAVDRVYLIESGQIVGTGTLDELGGTERLAELYLGV